MTNIVTEISRIEEPGDFRPTRAWTLDSPAPHAEVRKVNRLNQFDC